MNTYTKKLLAGALALALAGGACSSSSTTTTTTTTTAATTTTAVEVFSLDDVVADKVADDAIPAMGAIIFSSDAVLEQTVAGVRQNGGSDPVAASDRFHIGSNTKAMTAALIGRLVEAGVLGFDDTLAQSLGASGGTELGQVTLRQLLSHTGGLDDLAVMDEGIEDQVDDDAPPPEQRSAAAEWLLARPLDHEPGTRHAYSNVGYALVGAAAESVAGTPFSDLMDREVFRPLGIEGCSFGTPTDPAAQPLGHDPANQPVALADVEDPDALSPAGSVTYCTMDSWVKFLQEMMKAYNGESDWMSATTAEQIMSPILDGYGMGWGSTAMGEFTGFTHDGSNTLNYSTAWIVPEADLGWVVVTNAAVDPGGLAASLVTMQIGRYHFDG